MTRAASWSIVFLLLLSSPPATAAEIEVPLPGLLGEYSDQAKRTVAFQLVDIPDVVHSVSLRLSGAVGGGLQDCGIGQVYPIGMGLTASMTDDLSQPGCRVYAFFPPELGPGFTGPFTATAEFSVFAEPCWDFLMDGNGEVDVTACAEGTLCYVWAMPSAGITEAVLIINGEFPVRAQRSTWGQIKALYR